MRFLYLVFAGLVLALVFVFVMKPAAAHSWYEWQCCSDRDCGPVAFERVKITPEGYLVTFPDAEPQLIPYADKRIKPTPAEDPEQRFHVCTVAGSSSGRILCLYVPQGGV